MTQMHSFRVIHDRVIFLDFDGVLNSYETMPKKEKGFMFSLHRPLVANLNTIVRRTGAAVVVSSSWRKGMRWEECLREAGFEGEILGRTGTDPKSFRGEEVDEYLRKWGKDIREYCVIDDDSDFYPWQPHFKPSLFTGGLNSEMVERVVAHFS